MRTLKYFKFKLKFQFNYKIFIRFTKKKIKYLKSLIYLKHLIFYLTNLIKIL